MERYIIEQRLKVIQAYYENERSNQNAYRAHRDFFAQFNRQNVQMCVQSEKSCKNLSKPGL